MAITHFSFDKAQQLLQWSHDGEQIRVSGSGLEQAQLDAFNDRVFALEESPTLPGRLHVFAATGKEIAVLNPPDGFQFYYLTPYPKLGMAVVCVAPEPVEGFRDWHFGFDPKKKGKLFRHAPAY
jgi:hypothetical protein